METLAVIISMIVMFLWLRTEGNADRRHLTEMQKQDKKDLIEVQKQDKKDLTEMQQKYADKADQLIESMKQDVLAIREDVRAMQQESKDFHRRLCAIEERRGK